VPLRIQRVDVNVNRPGFMTTPTSCKPKQIRTTFRSVAGATSVTTTPYQVSGCRRLALKPRMTMKMVGSRQMKVGRHPGLDVTVRQAEGQAHLKKVAAKLPLSLALDPDNADALCSFEDGLRASCPANTRIGKATAVSPLLKRTLSGPVYFVQGIRISPKTGARIRTRPTLLVTLRGEVDLNLRARSEVVRDKLVSVFDSVPDAALSSFRLQLKGGKGGVLVATRPICGRKQVAVVDIDGQNGRRSDRNVRMSTPCKQKKGRR
jgi:hypothetical protein